MMMTELSLWILRTTGGKGIKEFNAEGSISSACTWGLKNILANVRYSDLQFHPWPMNLLTNIMEKYATFEAEVNAYAVTFYINHCGTCKGICCKPDYCEESITSSFLRRLRQHFMPDAVYDTERGWLRSAGCALPVGRPPVCHQYLCDTILNIRPGPDFRYALTLLSNLVNHIGKKALGRKHIVELQESSELKRINFTRFEKQLDEAHTAFKRMRAYLDGDVAKLDYLQDLKKICLPPRL